MDINDWLSWLGGDLTKEEDKVMRTAGLKILWRVWLVVFSAGAMGYLAIVGIPGFATNALVEAKLKPLATQVAQQTTAIQQLSEFSQQQTLQLLRVGLVDLQLKWCKAPHGEAKRLYFDRITEAQERFHKITGQDFPVPSCGDL